MARTPLACHCSILKMRAMYRKVVNIDKKYIIKTKKCILEMSNSRQLGMDSLKLGIQPKINIMRQLSRNNKTFDYDNSGLAI